jgi:hypothetical protein
MVTEYHNLLLAKFLKNKLIFFKDSFYSSLNTVARCKLKGVLLEKKKTSLAAATHFIAVTFILVPFIYSS